MSTPAVELNLYDLPSLAPPEDPIALIFPGQGSQKIGMGRDVFDNFESSRVVFAIATKATGIDVAGMCFDGPADALTATANAQPAILTASLAYLAAGLETGALPGRPTYLAGHSLGEYAALVAAGSLSAGDAIALVRERGRIMAEAAADQAGAMTAILGLNEQMVDRICTESGAEPANYNGPTQTVIGGTPAAVEKASQLARERGGKALSVNVSGAFHTSLMTAAAESFNVVLAEVQILEPKIPVISNVTAEPLRSAAEVRVDLATQIARPVQWNNSVRYIVERGVAIFIEIGPGRVLSTILKRLDLDLTCVSIDSAETLINRANV